MSDRLRALTQEWGTHAAVDLYLDRCQVDTPDWVVQAVWRLAHERRRRVSTVIDFGAGDGRFARWGTYDQYIGYEIDPARLQTVVLPPKAILEHRCAFSNLITDADMCVGNPPYVRNQDLPRGWREQATTLIAERTGVKISGLANAWQYFAFLALSTTRPDGLVALVIPYEWVSRPSVRALRRFIYDNGWDVDVYRLRDKAFTRVLTTSSITLIDKQGKRSAWRYFEQDEGQTFRRLKTPSGGTEGVIEYRRNTSDTSSAIFVRRGLSPGTQKVLTLTEGERVRHGLKIGSDVVPCITSLRQLGAEIKSLTETRFQKYYRNAGAKCWLIRTDAPPSNRLNAYLNDIPEKDTHTSTCHSRDIWWNFVMPSPPAVLVATGFRGLRPKIAQNAAGVVAVGAVAGVYGLSSKSARHVVRNLSLINLTDRIVSHSKGFRKVEIGQLETLIHQALASTE